jgi:ABC-type nitrate/sulfonate/bicarbonate transport system substrate-binding protein
MNRKTFLSSLLALITAPFLVQSKEKKPDLEAWIKANPELYKRIIATSLYNAIAKTNAETAEYYRKCLRMSGQVTVKGEYLIMVLNRKR